MRGQGLWKDRAQGLSQPISDLPQPLSCRSHASSTARVWQGGQPGNGTVHQCRARKLFTSSVSDLHGNTKLDVQVQTRVLMGVFGSRWFSLTFVRTRVEQCMGHTAFSRASLDGL